MNNQTLPIIVSVPHGGDVVAPEVKDHSLLSKEDIFSDGDPLTRSLYDFRKDVAYYFETEIARAAVDLNRPPDDLPPKNIDGVVKSHTVTGKKIYHKRLIPSKNTLQVLLNRYYLPYHKDLERKSRRADLLCGIDCHTMLDKSPPISGNPGEKRPFICLSNRGNIYGDKVRGRPLTCPPEMIRSLSYFLKEQFPEEADNITLNDPFLGGYIIRQHSRHLPWIQIELNRKAYLGKQWFDPEQLTVCNRRIAVLRTRLRRAIKNFSLYYLSLQKTWRKTG